MTSVLSIIATTISIITLLFYLFQEYREVFTIYWFSNYEIVFIPIECDVIKNPVKFISTFNDEFNKRLSVCEFKHIWVGDPSKIYYYQSIYEHFPKLDDMSIHEILFREDEHKYFSRMIITNKGRKVINKRIKTLQKDL